MSSVENINSLISDVSSKMANKKIDFEDIQEITPPLHTKGLSATVKLDKVVNKLKRKHESEVINLDEGEIVPIAPHREKDLICVFSLFSDIKKISRQLQFRNISKRENIKRLREKVDDRYVFLKSREYELQLLKDQITALSKQSESMEQVDLIPEELFDSQAPEKYLNSSSDHEKMLNRLNYEYDERKRLQEILHDLGKTKSRMNLQSSNFKKDFAKIKSLASSFSNSSAPLKNAVAKLKPT